jgi:LysM repeat protein
MSNRDRRGLPPVRPSARPATAARVRLAPLILSAAAVALAAALPARVLAQPSRMPVLPQWRATAERVAEAGVGLEDLAPNAPDSHVVQRGDTLWGISSMFLKSPWRWPELWGMNFNEIHNPHLIYPGQVLVLERKDGRATLHVAQAASGAAPGELPGNVVRLSPHARSEVLSNGAIASVSLDMIGPFLTEADIFDSDALAHAPRIVATQEDRVLASRGETVYVRGDLGGAKDFRLFRELTALTDPDTNEILGYEGRYVGTAEFTRAGTTVLASNSKGLVVPDSFLITSTRLEAEVGDRLSPVPQQELIAYVPHAPKGPISGRIVSIYGDGLNAGQNQIVAISRGNRDGLERGDVLALWRAGDLAVDRTGAKAVDMRLPDEREGLMFVFRTFDRVSYALILNVGNPVRRGDRFTEP